MQFNMKLKSKRNPDQEVKQQGSTISIGRSEGEWWPGHLLN